MASFTRKDALKIQAQQIQEWSMVLNADALAKVEAEAKWQNAARANKDPYSVWRGTDITEFVQNLASRLRRES